VHRGVVWLLRHQTRWVVDVLIALGHLPKRPYVLELLPTETWPVGEENRGREIRADLVLRLWESPAPVDPSLDLIRRSRVIGLILDFQLHRKRDKGVRILEYDSAYPPVLGTKILFVGLTLHEPVARWMRRVLARKQLIMRTCVLSPRDIPRSGPIDARAEPRRALLEAMLHVQGKADLPLLKNALRALRRFEGNEWLLYREMLDSHMEEQMILQAYEELELEELDDDDDEDWSDYVLTPRERKSFLYVNGARDGQYEGRAGAILDVLQLRGIEVDPATKQHILACRDSDQLHTWLARAMTLTRASELLDP
jgi:hypothetical protein